jgi:formate dehydrogenase major subunit
VLKRHFARYTPEMVEEICGVSPEQFHALADAMTQNSGRERTTAFCYAVGWTHHTVGVQYIRTAAILQLLLGNMGRPGGGIMALRGHASIQGSTDIPTLFNLLPGYIPMPHAHEDQSLAHFVEGDAGRKGGWGNMKAYTVSLLKAWWGDAATQENDFCFDYLPRLTGDHGTFTTVARQIDEAAVGYFLLGQNPAVGTSNSKMQRLGMANLDWLVVRDLVMIESATFWKDGPEIETGELETKKIPTEIFFCPAAAHTEKTGSFTNTHRCCSGTTRRPSPRATRAASCGSTTTSAGGSREAGRLDRPARPSGARPHLGLPARGPAWRRAQCRRDPGRDQRLWRGRRAAGVVRPAQGRRLDVQRLLDLRRRDQGRRQPG